MTKIRTFLFIIIPVVVGLYTRLDDIKAWEANKFYHFYQNRPVFTGNDSYFFARYGKEYFEGKYKAGETDPLREVPDFTTYPEPVPLLSLISGFFAKVQGTYIENVSVWLVPILAVLIAFPLVFFFNRIGYPVAGGVGAFLTVISVSYLPRTTIARLDTDSLNIFFPFLVATFLLLFVKEEKNEKLKYIYAFFAGISAYLYMWWYFKPSLLLAVTGGLIVFLLIERKLKLKKEDLIGLGIFILFANPMNFYTGIQDALGQVKKYIFETSQKAVEGGFPNIQHFVTELSHYEFNKLSKVIAGSEYIVIISFIGLGILFLRRWKPMFLLLPFLALGLIPLIGPMRFAMYLAPFVGIGIGAIGDEIVRFISNRKSQEPPTDNGSYSEEAIEENKSKKVEFVSSLAVFLVIIGLIAYMNKIVFALVAKPKYPAPLTGDFLALKEKTEKNSWIWTWWSEGYMVEYLGERATFVDPGSQFTPKTYFGGLTYSTSSPEIARNVIFSIATIGLKGINEELSKGVSPETIKKKAEKGEYINFSKIKNPIYWLFTIRSVKAFDSINKIGTWNFKMQNGLEGQYMYLGMCKSLNQHTIVCSRWVVDTREGVVKDRVTGRQYPVKRISLVDTDRSIRTRKYRDSGVYFEVASSKYGHFGFMMQEQAYKSMYNQMYILRNYDNRYFELVHDHFPFAVLYKVKE